MKFIFGLLLLPLLCFANEEITEKEKKEAVEKAQALLKDTAFQNGYMSDQQTKEAHQKVNEVAKNPRHQQEIYSLGSEAFDSIVKKANGDPAKIMEILTKAQEDPKAFLNSLSPEQRERIRALASEIEKKKAP